MMIIPPSRYPDLFAVLNVLISTPVFVLTWLWSIKCGVEVGWALSGLGSSISSAFKSSKDADGATSIGHPSERSVEMAE
jgi:alpha-1,3-glucosyltransferase